MHLDSLRTYQIRRFTVKDGGWNTLAEFIRRIDNDFQFPISSKVDLEQYCTKLIHYSTILGAFISEKIVGILAFYCNDLAIRKAYISYFGILPESRGIRVGKALLGETIEYAKQSGMKSITVQTWADNNRGIKLYSRFGFALVDRIHDRPNGEVTVVLTARI